mmetsp:Transcript_35063/g.79969  ORF Transcript_35063/g.79969 Transcript_35063/m.79969 type:complete len:288 (-) Transcript_35063:636-1499(-)
MRRPRKTTMAPLGGVASQEYRFLSHWWKMSATLIFVLRTSATEHTGLSTNWTRKSQSSSDGMLSPLVNASAAASSFRVTSTEASCFLHGAHQSSFAFLTTGGTPSTRQIPCAMARMAGGGFDCVRSSEISALVSTVMVLCGCSMEVTDSLGMGGGGITGMILSKMATASITSLRPGVGWSQNMPIFCKSDRVKAARFGSPASVSSGGPALGSIVPQSCSLCTLRVSAAAVTSSSLSLGKQRRIPRSAASTQTVKPRPNVSVLCSSVSGSAPSPPDLVACCTRMSSSC